MENFIIDQVSWHTEKPRNYDFDGTIIYKYFKSLIQFLEENKLTTKPIITEGEPMTRDTKIQSSDLTEEGMLFIKAVYKSSWIDKVVDGKISPDDQKMLIKALNKIRDVK